jgi:hypothetical protein
MLKACAFTAAALVGGIIGSGSFASGATPPPATPVDNQFFDWFTTNQANYVPSPFLSDSSAGGVNAFLQSMPAGAIRAVKIEGPISTATSNLIFNNPNYHVSYVLGDFEQGASTPPKLKQLSDQIHFIDGNLNKGFKTQSFNAFIGNFGFQQLPDDQTLPPKYKNKEKNNHSYAAWSENDYFKAGLSMSMPEQYSGSASYKNPAAGDSNAPNIRSAMFVLPALRLSQTAVQQDAGTQIVPYIARFNNWNNLALDTNRDASDGYRFVPGQAIPAASGLPAVPAAKTADQMLSRRDFATDVLHYRLRGANSFVLFEPGVEGYLKDQQRSDARTGWTESHVDDIFQNSDATLLLGKDTDYAHHTNALDPNGDITIDGHQESDEQAGAMFSGVYSLTAKKMDVLLSNMDGTDHDLGIPDLIGGYAVHTTTFSLDGGSHLLVEYQLTTSGVNKGWSTTSQTVPFLSLPNGRNEIGIPEPTSLTALAIFGMLGFTPRRRKSSKA